MSASSDYDEIIKAASEEWDIDPRILRSVMMQESGGHLRAVSSAGAKGLMQIMPATGQELGLTNPYDPQQSIFAGAKYLSQLFDKYGKTSLALAAYNAGPQRVDDYLAGRGSLPRETLAYVPSVAKIYASLEPPKSTETATQPQAPVSANTPLILGDSIGQGIQAAAQAQGYTKVGANPQQILSTITGLPDDQVRGRNVVLSGGASNNPDQVNLVEDQIKALKAKGAANVTVVGVGDRPDFKAANLDDKLAGITYQNGGTFVALDPATLGKDRVHPTNYTNLAGNVFPQQQQAPSQPALPPNDKGNATMADKPSSSTKPKPPDDDISDEDFLKRTTGAATDEEHDDAFLSRTGGNAKPATAQSAGSREGFPQPSAAPVTPTDTYLGFDQALDRLKHGVSQGVVGGASIIPDEAINNPSPLIKWPSRVAQGATELLGGLYGGFQGAAEGIGGMLGGNAGERLGRDIASIPESMAGMRGPAAERAALQSATLNKLSAPEAPPAAAAAPAPSVAAQPPSITANPAAAGIPAVVPPGTQVPVLPRILDLIREDNRLQANRPSEIPPDAAIPKNPLSVKPAPSVVPSGAVITPQTPTTNPLAVRQGTAASGSNPLSTSGSPPMIPPVQAATSEMQRVLAPAKEGADSTIYVPDTKPTLAETTGDAGIAAQQKLNRQQNPEQHVTTEKANNDARIEYYNKAAGTPDKVEQLKAARSTQAQKDLDTAFGSKAATDATPVVSAINQILTDPRLGERDVIQSYIRPILNKLYNENGSLKTDPENLYGIRQNVADLLSKAGQSSDPKLALVQRQLMTVRSALDASIEAGAPGYRQYLTNYSAASKPIDAMQYLQEARPKLTNAQQTMTPAAFDRFMKDTVESRASGGVGPALSLDDQQMQTLFNIHSDLKRFQNINRANPRGSDTSMLSMLAAKTGELAAHSAANYFAPVLGSVAVQMGKNALHASRVNRATQRFLNPPSP